MFKKSDTKFNMAHETKKRLFSVDLSKPTGLVYINSMKTRNLRGWWWMVRNAPHIARLASEAEGCLQLKVSLVSWNEVLLVSYWESEEALGRAYRSPDHVEMMRYAFQHPDDFILANETYNQPTSTRYLNARNGYALTQPSNMSGGNND